VKTTASPTPDSTPENSEKWEVQLRKGSLELAILAALWGGRLYGLEILRDLESKSDLIVVEGTVYPLLNRLRSLGLVESEWVESNSGHPRKYYRLTLAGRQRALEMTRIWAKFSTRMNNLLANLNKEANNHETPDQTPEMRRNNL
jgi:PadR family transcriptional regulator, regulatory protein PadR